MVITLDVGILRLSLYYAFGFAGSVRCMYFAQVSLLDVLTVCRSAILAKLGWRRQAMNYHTRADEESYQGTITGTISSHKSDATHSGVVVIGSCSGRCGIG
jgi:hypothetical protein